MIRAMRLVWLRCMMRHSLGCEAAYSRASAEFRSAVMLAIIDGRDPTPWQSAATIYQTLISVEQDLQRSIRSQLIALGDRPELLA